MASVKIAGWTLRLPQSRLLRLIIGGGLILFGLFGFLPLLGFWMIPAGLVVLSVDSHWARRLRRRSEVAIARWRSGRAKRGD